MILSAKGCFQRTCQSLSGVCSALRVTGRPQTTTDHVSVSYKVSNKVDRICTINTQIPGTKAIRTQNAEPSFPQRPDAPLRARTPLQTRCLVLGAQKRGFYCLRSPDLSRLVDWSPSMLVKALRPPSPIVFRSRTPPMPKCVCVPV